VSIESTLDYQVTITEMLRYRRINGASSTQTEALAVAYMRSCRMCRWNRWGRRL